MLNEQCAFLANMKPRLQHTQMLAVRAAMKGDDAALVQIRQSRNQASTLPDGITATHLFITVPGQPTAFHEAVKAIASFLTNP